MTTEGDSEIWTALSDICSAVKREAAEGHFEGAFSYYDNALNIAEFTPHLETPCFTLLLECLDVVVDGLMANVVSEADHRHLLDAYSRCGSIASQGLSVHEVARVARALMALGDKHLQARMTHGIVTSAYSHAYECYNVASGTIVKSKTTFECASGKALIVTLLHKQGSARLDAGAVGCCREAALYFNYAAHMAREYNVEEEVVDRVALLITSVEARFLTSKDAIEFLDRQLFLLHQKHNGEAMLKMLQALERAGDTLVVLGDKSGAYECYTKIVSAFSEYRASLAEGVGMGAAVAAKMGQLVTGKLSLTQNVLQPTWPHQRKRLEEARGRAASLTSAAFTLSMMDFIRGLLDECQEALGPPPCDVTYLGLGSMARYEMCPGSDLEFAMVLQRDSSDAKTWAKAFSALLELKVICLGESYTAQTPVVKGFRFDEGGNFPFSNKGETFVGTVAHLVSSLKPQMDGNLPADIIAANTLQEARWFHGSLDLGEAFRVAVDEIMNANDGQLRRNFATNLLVTHLQDFPPNLQLDTEQCVLVKEALLRLPVFVMNTVAMYHGVLDNSSSAVRIEHLVARGHMSRVVGMALNELIRVGCRLRTMAHLHYKDETEIVYLRDCPPGGFSIDAINGMRENLLDMYVHVLTPLFACAQEFVKVATGAGNNNAKMPKRRMRRETDDPPKAPLDEVFDDGRPFAQIAKFFLRSASESIAQRNWTAAEKLLDMAEGYHDIAMAPEPGDQKRAASGGLTSALAGIMSDPFTYQVNALRGLIVKEVAQAAKNDSEPPRVRIAVTGVYSRIGAEIMDRLQSEEHVAVHAISRTLPPQDQYKPFVTVKSADNANVEALVSAFKGCDIVMLLPPFKKDRRIQLVNQVEAAKQAGVKHLVHLSYLFASDNATTVCARDSFEDEEIVRNSGLSYVIVKTSAYYQKVLALQRTPIKVQNKIFVPMGNARHAFIDVNDVAEFLRRILVAPLEHSRRTYEISGPASVTFSELAKALSEALGRTIEYEEVPPESSRAAMLNSGVDPMQVDLVQNFFEACRDSEIAATAKMKDFVDIMKCAPMCVNSWAQRDAATFEAEVRADLLVNNISITPELYARAEIGGLLQKQGERWPNRWQPRYSFVVDRMLLYMAHQSDTTPRGVIDLRGCKAQDVPKMGAEAFSITTVQSLTGPKCAEKVFHQRTYYFKVFDAAMKDNWMRVLSKYNIYYA